MIVTSFSRMRHLQSTYMVSAATEREEAVREPLISMAAGTLQELVSAAASVHSDRTAVTYYDDQSVSLLYRDVLKLAGELSDIFRESCSPSNGVIGLYCSDDLLVPVWILGILQSPAAYVPLDPEAPGLLSARVMNLCGLKYCAVKTDLLQRFQTALVKHISAEVCVVLPKFKLTLIRVKLLPVAAHKPETQQSVAQKADGADLCGTAVVEKASGHRDLAYVLHTSGTTGFPKIVRVPHKCILPNILHLRSLFQMSADDVVFLASPLTFDPSVVDIFLALSSGAQLLIIPSVIKKVPNRLAQVLFKNHKTTVLQVTPTLLSRFGHRILKQEVLSSVSSLRVLALGGEACPSPALLRSWKHKDNKTHIYNIYGITEVSCWACCYKIPQSLLQSSNPPSSMVSSVPLGAPLMDTVVEVRDEHGCVVTEGEGQLFIGGKDRVCLLDDEEAVTPGTMRATGDWVNVKDTQLLYLGRRDRLIKRHGKRVNLDNLQQLILSLPQVEACAVGLYEGFRLLAFVVASASGDQKAASPLPSVQERVGKSHSPFAQHQEDPPSPVKHHQEEETSGMDGGLSRLIVNQLSLLLPSYSVPDTLVLVPALCLTPHGKVDMEALMKIYQRQRQCLESSQGDFSKLKQTLRSFWQSTLGFAEDVTVDEESNFLLSGGDSLKALHLCEDILTAVGVTSPGLLEVILDGTFSDVLRYVARVTLMPPLENSTPSLLEAKKRHADAPSVFLAKRERKESTAGERPQGEKRAVKVIGRGGEVIEMKTGNEEMGENLQPMQGDVLDLSLSWSSDTGRCVDASPVLLVHKRTDQRSDVTKTTVFIGSHSHRIQALDLDTGSLLWERVLGDRIEASAAVSRCGTLVVIGCYDGCVYFLCAASGETRWIFETGDAVKSCPAVDQHTGLMIVGSHDGHVYALNPELQQCVWKHHCGGRAVFSSPYLQPSLRQLYVASLGGHLLCLNPDSGEVLWSHCRDVPFFSSPNSSSGLVAIGSVDGNICCFSNKGELMWQYLTKGPVFSSPCVTPDQQRLLCGSHDGHLYCLNCADGSLVWTFETSGKVYSTPCVFDGSAMGRRGILVGVASTDGTVWILDGQNGQMLASHTLPGELFSSPVVYEQSLVVGCRNDYVYCFKLTVKEEAQKY
ncbi:LOW QUALITY PROTEIN: beta-alanine-activating enzyme [Lates calcarifer]|uniref:LOW QUALITY PROTEIN: beta-alanine-activating enzyme n=1 Tax=Lates calcarifer TaxID=8187 RepID=A0AAJ7PIF2_LATCA|nr:LOW QUALITY PROTEIN: beta-alanine-activating enzyme [Lates calcarifer]